MPVAPPQIAPSGEPLADFGDRLLARLIDGAILGVATVVVLVPAMFVVIGLISNSLDGGADSVDSSAQVALVFGIIAVYAGVMVFSLLAGYVYEVEMMFRTGQTIGKRVMKIRIVSIGDQPMGRATAARRWLASSIAGMIIPAFSWVDGLWQLWDQPWKQCLHDKFAKTVVVKDAPARGTT